MKQINSVNDDGSYTYGFEAADGSFKVETRDVLGIVKGKYGYVDDNGQLQVIEYIAGETTGPEIMEEELIEVTVRPTPRTTRPTTRAPVPVTTTTMATPIVQSPTVRRLIASEQPVKDEIVSSPHRNVRILKQINRVNDDGSYTYGFEAADGSFKVETRDNLGNVKGKYGYVDETGALKVIEYAAGLPGFEATGDHIPVPAVPVRSAPRTTTTRPVVRQPVPVQQPAPQTTLSSTPINRIQPAVAPTQQLNDIDHNRINNVRRGFSFAIEAPVLPQQVRTGF